MIPRASGFDQATALLLLGALLLAAPATPCTTVLIGRALTADGSVIHAHNEDMGNDAVGRLWAAAPATHGPNSRVRVPYVEIEQPADTFGYWASGNAPGAEGLGTKIGGPYDSILVGINDQGVSMSCNWAHSREENLEGVGIRRFALRQILLERATSARHGVELLGELIDTHGQADWGGLIYHLADSREAWVVETTTHHWVARRVRDDEVWVTANRFRIGTEYDLASKGLVEHAIEQGWQGRDEPFSFAGAYGRPEKMDQPYDTRREHRVETLLAALGEEIEPADLVPILRDRYEGTTHYTPPQPGPVWREDLDSQPDVSRTLSTNLAQSTFIAHMREIAPDAIGPVMWFGFATPSYAGYTPLYPRAGSSPRELYQASPTEGTDATWTYFRRLQRLVDPDYDARYPAVRSAWDSEHSDGFEAAVQIETRVRGLLQQGRTQEAESELGELTRQRSSRDLERVRQLLTELGDEVD